jgi:Uma2 family endonuclease
MVTKLLNKRRNYTIKEYEDMPEEVGKRYELVKGKILITEGSDEPRARIGSRIQIFLGKFVFDNELGSVYGFKARFIIPSPNLPADQPTVRRCNVSFVSKERLTPDVSSIPYAPDLAIEIVSDSDTFINIEEKSREYRNAGSKLVWVIEPEDELVHIYRAGSNQRETLTVEDELDGENVVPGFKLKISTLFV